MRIDDSSELARFEKFRDARRKRDFQEKGKDRKLNARGSYEETRYREQLDEQFPGSIHLVDNSKIEGFQSEGDYWHRKLRPGSVLTPPSKESTFETEWIPFSTRTARRDPANVVCLFPGAHPVDRECVILLEHIRYFKCTTLSARRGVLPDAIMTEVKQKLGRE